MNPEEKIGRMLEQGAIRSFRPGFTDRVMGRLRATRSVPLSAGLERSFLRLVPLALAAAAVLAALNVRQGSQGQTKVDAILGLPAVTLASAYQLGDTP